MGLGLGLGLGLICVTRPRVLYFLPLLLLSVVYVPMIPIPAAEASLLLLLLLQQAIPDPATSKPPALAFTVDVIARLLRERMASIALASALSIPAPPVVLSVLTGLTVSFFCGGKFGKARPVPI